MKVILTADVPKVGNKYDIKEFPQGYAQNVLISRGLAILATPGELAKVADKKAQIERRKEEENKIFESLVSSINNTKIEIKAKSNEKGHLFKAVSPVDVAKAIKDITGIEIDASSVVMEHIKELGSHNIEIKRGNKKGKCEIIVIKN
jgi:large subunit ribosomal protein L9